MFFIFRMMMRMVRDPLRSPHVCGLIYSVEAQPWEAFHVLHILLRSLLVSNSEYHKCMETTMAVHTVLSSFWGPLRDWWPSIGLVRLWSSAPPPHEPSLNGWDCYPSELIQIRAFLGWPGVWFLVKRLKDSLGAYFFLDGPSLWCLRIPGH